MKFWIDLSSGAGTLLGSGPVVTASTWRYTKCLSRAGEWATNIPAGEPRIAAAGLKYKMNAYNRGGWLGGGTIEDIRLRKAGQNASLDFSGADPLQELASVTVGKIEVGSSGGSSQFWGRDVLLAVLANLPAGWSYQLDAYPEPITARFVDDSTLGALTALAERTGQMFRVERSGSSWLLRWFAYPESTTILATDNAEGLAMERNLDVCRIEEIERIETGWDIANTLIVYGAGEGDARLTLAAATSWPNGTSLSNDYYTSAPGGRTLRFQANLSNNTINEVNSWTQYGVHVKPVEFKDVGPVSNSDADVRAAANTLVLAAINELAESAWAQQSYALRVVGLRRDVQPGQMIRVRARQSRDGAMPIDIDAQLIVLEVGRNYSMSGEMATELVVSSSNRFARSDNEMLVREIRESRVMRAYPQMGPSVDTISYRDDIDDDRGADLPFWLGKHVTLINQVVVRFRLDRLRSTAKSIGGTVNGTVDIAPHQHYIPPHLHSFYVLPGGLTSDPVYLVGMGGGAGVLAIAGGGGATRVDTDPGSGGVTSDSGGGQFGTSINLSSALELQYGIYEDTQSPYTVADLAWTVNGASVPGSPVSIGGSWYELDVTAQLSNATTLRPLRSDNVIGVAVANKQGKRVRVTAQIEVRSVIQSIAVL